MNRNYCKLPKIIHDWLWINKAWIVGSGVDWYLQEIEQLTKDFDIIIPPKEWNFACKIIDKSFIIKTNSFGGFCTILDGIKVDFWPDNLEDYFEKSIYTSGKSEIKALRLKPYTLQ
jgi:hypothetical protein